MRVAHEQLGEQLLSSLIHLKKSKGQVALEDVGALLEEVAGSALEHPDSQEVADVKGEIEKLASDIILLKGEIFAMAGDEIHLAHPGSAAGFGKANQELEEVILATENATHIILDAAEAIQNSVNRINDPKWCERVSGEVVKIFNACNFQDITGQRIHKVIRLMEYMEARLANLVVLTGGTLPDGYTPKPVEAIRRPDEHLMEGPQASASAFNQADIDALFDTL